MLSRLCNRALLRTVAVGCKSTKHKSMVGIVLDDSSVDLLVIGAIEIVKLSMAKRLRTRKLSYSTQ